MGFSSALHEEAIASDSDSDTDTHEQQDTFIKQIQQLDMTQDNEYIIDVINIGESDSESDLTESFRSAMEQNRTDKRKAKHIKVTDYSVDLCKRSIEDFREVCIIGMGSFGLVFLVQDKHSKQYYAKKSIKKARLTVDDISIKNRRNERDILTSVKHPNIVKLFYAFQDDESVHLILEFIPGGELFHHLSQRRRFSEDWTAFYMAEIAEALHHLHSQGIVYRDLKPENCLLNKDGHVVLTDFGLSSQDPKCHSVLGTPSYSAPEVLRGREYSFKADWWAFGVMCYELMVGDIPFQGTDRQKLLNVLNKRGVVTPVWFSQDATDIVRRLLQRSEDKRWDVDNDWERFKQHRFFRRAAWSHHKIRRQPPILPVTTYPEKCIKPGRDEITSGIDNLNRSPMANKVDQQLFRGFSFVADKAVLQDHFNKLNGIDPDPPLEAVKE